MIKTALTLALVAASAGAVAVPQIAAAQAPVVRPTPQQEAAKREAERRERMQRRAQRLREVLQLRPEQEPALSTYMAALYPARRASDNRPSTRGMTAPQKLDAEYARRIQRLNEWKQEADATKTFYNQLAESQRRAFDALDLVDD